MKTFGKYLTYTFILTLIVSCDSQPNLGIFQGNSDIGNVKFPGSVDFDKSDNSYTLSGGGTNMWAEKDDLHYVWKEMSGDASLAATIEWLGEGLDPHRKAGLIIRQSLDPGSVYADAVIHGDGLTSLQFRESQDETTHEIISNITKPERLRIEKTGDYLSMSVSNEKGDLESSSGSVRMQFSDPFYIGIGVCSHNNDTIETAVFTDVILETLELKPDSLKQMESVLETIAISSFDRKVVYITEKHIEAPNWSPDGQKLIYNSGGLLYKIPVSGGEPEMIPTDFAVKINNDHGISPDGTQLVISDQTETGSSLIYILPMEGGVPKKITPEGPSYWHGWSPDGKTLTYCAERKGNYDVYTIPVKGGKETRLTTAEGLDDGPEYSPDGKYIYFNSVRTGTMQIWRMKTNGDDQEQITTDEYNDWFAHPSPDGQWIVYVSFGTDVEAGSHPPNKHVMLRLMNLETKEVQIMTKIFGGQGTINVPSWSPDSKNIAFVSYRVN